MAVIERWLLVEVKSCCLPGTVGGLWGQRGGECWQYGPDNNACMNLLQLQIAMLAP